MLLCSFKGEVVCFTVGLLVLSTSYFVMRYSFVQVTFHQPVTSTSSSVFPTMPFDSTQRTDMDLLHPPVDCTSVKFLQTSIVRIMQDQSFRRQKCSVIQV